MSPPRFQPALLGGLFVGVLSALPIVSIGNLCCCLWVVMGGALAAYLMQQDHGEPVPLLDGALVGFLAGVFGAVVYVFVAVPLTFVTAPFQREIMARVLENTRDVPAELRRVIENMSTGIGGVIVGFFVMLVSGITFGTVGGLLGALVFRRREPPPAPPDAPAPPGMPSSPAS